MTRMIPTIIDPATSSPGEHEVFDRLRDDPATEDWIALHSLHLSRHVRAIVGEVDFVIIVPAKGVLVIEVKACRSLARQNGVWFYGRDETPDPRGPFKQASEAMHSVRSTLAGDTDLSGVVFWSAVLFPYVPFDERSAEWHPWQVIDAHAFRSHPLSALLDGVLDRAREFLAAKATARWFDPGSSGPTLPQCRVIARRLRPDFEVSPTVSVIRRERQEELTRFTQEQFEALDQMDANPRILFEGPAGTGKTFLAIEAARRSASEGRSILLVCFNRMLGDWLSSQFEPADGDLTAGTLHSYMSKLAGLGAGDIPNEDHFWRVKLPERAVEALLDDESEPRFDEIVVDEAQDILEDQYLDVLDLSLKGGLATGRWRVFGDFERQALYAAGGDSRTRLLTERSKGAARFGLAVNCRNVPRVVEFVRLLARLGHGYSRVLRPDNGFEPRLRYFSNSDSDCDALEATLAELYSDGFAGSDIVVLSPRASGSCAERVGTAPWCDRLTPVREAASGQVGYCSIHAFKGMEAPAIIVTDIEAVRGPQMESLFYVAVSRATDRLVVLLDGSLRTEVLRLLDQPANPRGASGVGT